MEITRETLIKWVMMDLDSVKITRACKRLGLNGVIEVCGIDNNDLLNKAFLEILLSEYNEIRSMLYNQMNYESTLPEFQWCGGYMPGDVWTEAEIELNTLIGNMTDLMAML